MSEKRSLSKAGRRHFLLTLGISGLGFGCPAVFARSAAARSLDVPYEPSPQFVVDKMLELAQVHQQDLLYDLGCGDGRIVITAAQRYGARGVGVDLDPQRIAEARANATKVGVEDRTRFMEGDLYQVDFSEATVVTLFLWPQVNLKLRPILWRQLRPGTRVVSHHWDMGREWPPEKTASVANKKIYYWTIREHHKKQAATRARPTAAAEV